MTPRERLEIARTWQALVARHGRARATDIAAATWPRHWQIVLGPVYHRAAEIEAIRHARHVARADADAARQRVIRTRPVPNPLAIRVVVRGPRGLEVVQRLRLRLDHQYGEYEARGQHIVADYAVRRGRAVRLITWWHVEDARRGRWLAVLRNAYASRYDPGRYARYRSARRAERLLRRRGRDGALIGWRAWHLKEESAVLISPYRGTVWHGPVLTAEVWSDRAAVRGLAGIHATIRHASEYEEGYGEMPIRGFPPRGWAYGRVRGYGRYVLGTTGWRAERVVVDLLVVHPATPASTVRALEDRYQCRVIQPSFVWQRKIERMLGL